MDVILYDQAGHGESSGVATLDPAHMAGYLAAVLHDARRRGYSRVGVLGLSLGAATAIHAAAQRAPVDAVASVSCPAAPPQAPGRAHENAWLARTVRAWYGLLGTRLEAVPRWRNAAIEVVATVAPCPLLVVHCGRDTLISRESSEALYVAAREPRAWILDDRAFHAAPHESVTSILAWLDEQLGA
jgi:pimeloyl-ACP methyl ester carboxylesterase